MKDCVSSEESQSRSNFKRNRPVIAGKSRNSTQTQDF